MGPACLAPPLARSIVCPACGRGGLGGRTGPCRASSSSLTWADCGRPGSVAPARGMWDTGIRSVIVRVRHHGPLRLARIRWVSAACAGQVDAYPAGVRDRQALVECVSRSHVVGLYEGVLLGKFGLLEVVAVVGWFPSRWLGVNCRGLRRDEVILGLPCPLLTCGWPVRDSRRVCAAVCCRCTAGDRLPWAGHACAASGGAGRSRRCCLASS